MRLSRTLCALAFLVPALAATAPAADHRDAPLISNNQADDITDVYAFVGPNAPDHAVFIMTLYPNAPNDAAFPRRGVKLHFDLDGDAWQDLTFAFKFGKLKNNGKQKIKGVLSGSPDSSLNRKLIKGKTTPPGREPNVIDAKRNIRAFAGLRDDPFFGDARFLDRPAVCPPANDSFAGTNVLSLVLEIPAEVLMPGANEVPPIGVWAETKRDSLGLPLTNTLYIPPNKLLSGDPRDKDLFNETHPHDQEDAFFQPVRRTFSVLNDDEIAIVFANDTFPNLLGLDPRQPPGFPNGRRLQDDVIDLELNRLTGGIEDTDCVPRNDVPFNDAFPYLASPHGPND